MQIIIKGEGSSRREAAKVQYCSTGCLKIDAIHWYDNDLIVRQAQWRSFGTRLVKKCILWARDIKSMFFLIVIIYIYIYIYIYNIYIYIPWHGIFFFFLVSCLSNKSLSYYWVASILRQFRMILSLNKEWRKIFFLSCPRHCDRG